VIRIVCLVWLLSGGIAQAQVESIVRSGEHEGFSRLVFDSQQSLDWTLEQQNNGYTLSFKQPTPIFDTGQVYRFISKSRLLSIVPLPAPQYGYFLEIAKDHLAEAFVTERGVLVVDIKVGDRPRMDVDSSVSSEATSRFVPSPQMYVLQPPRQQIEGNISRQENGNRTVYLVQKSEPSPSKKLPLRLPAVKVLAAQQRLKEALETARVQGVIDLTDEKVNASGSNRLGVGRLNLRATGIAPLDVETITGSVDGNLLEHLNLDAQSVYDRDFTEMGEQQVRERDGATCLENELLDVENWGADVPVERIGNLRRNLVGEFDRVNITALENLVKLYVFLGFGTEARALLSNYDGALKNQAILTELAFLIEDGGVQDESVLRDQGHCDGRGALWAILANGSIPIGEIPDLQLIADLFAQLPSGMRQRMGPRLGTVLLEAGFDTGGETIVNLTARAAGTESPHLELLSARLALSKGKTLVGEGMMRELVMSNSPNTTDALIYLTNSLIDRNGPISDDLVIELATRAFELRFSPVGSRLRQLEILALARQQRQSEAFEILTYEQEIETIDPEIANQIARSVFLSFNLDEGRPANLMETYFNFSNLLTKRASMDDARRHIARGIFEAGLPDTALQIMEVLRRRFTPEDILLVSEINLVLQNPDITLELVEGNDASDARSLRVRALSQKREFSRALDNADPSVSSDRKDDLAWRAGRWSDLATSGTKSRQMAYQYFEERGSTLERSVSGLTEIGELAEKSAAARAEVVQLLQEHPLP
jgi:hypothetical protein